MPRCISTSLIGLPRIRALPAVGKISPIKSLMVVDLPAPFGPINPNTSPVSTCIFSPSSEVLFLRFKNPKGYSLVRFSISIATCGMSSLLASRASPSIAQQKIVRGEKIHRRKQLRFGGSRQLSSIPTCCTQETVQRGAQNFLVEYSRCRISGVYCANGIPGYPRCCEHQCTSPSSQIYK